MILEDKVKVLVKDICQRAWNKAFDNVEFALDNNSSRTPITYGEDINRLLGSGTDLTNLIRVYFNKIPKGGAFHDYLGYSSMWRYLLKWLLYYMEPSEKKNSLARLFGVSIGKGVVVEKGVYFDPIFPQLIEIGDNTHIAGGTYLFTHYQQNSTYALGAIKIGSNVDVGGDLILFGTVIEDNVQVMHGAMIGPSNIRHVSEGAVIGTPAQEPEIKAVTESKLTEGVHTIIEKLKYAPLFLKQQVYKLLCPRISKDVVFPYCSCIYGNYRRLKIGSGTQIAPRVTLQKYVIGDHKPDNEYSTEIGNNVTIGTLAKIGVDVVIGDNVQIDAGAVVPSGSRIPNGQRVHCEVPQILGNIYSTDN